MRPVTRGASSRSPRYLDGVPLFHPIELIDAAIRGVNPLVTGRSNIAVGTPDVEETAAARRAGLIARRSRRQPVDPLDGGWLRSVRLAHRFRAEFGARLCERSVASRPTAGSGEALNERSRTFATTEDRACRSRPRATPQHHGGRLTEACDLCLVIDRSRQGVGGRLNRGRIACLDDGVDVQFVELIGVCIATSDNCPHWRLVLQRPCGYT